jgi:hypothetical protein
VELKTGTPTAALAAPSCSSALVYHAMQYSAAGTAGPSLVGFGLVSSAAGMPPLAFRTSLAAQPPKRSVIAAMEQWSSYENGMSAWDPLTGTLYGLTKAASDRGSLYAVAVDVHGGRLLGGVQLCPGKPSPAAGSGQGGAGGANFTFTCPFNFFYL